MDSCLNCRNFIDEGEDGKCYIYDIPNHDISICLDWRKKE